LERPVQPDPDPQPIKNRSLYLVYGITLGLAVILALLAIVFQNQALPPAVSAQAGVLTQTVVPTRNITPVESTSTSTPLPAVPPTPNEQTPSALGVTSSELRGLTVTIWHPWTGTEGLALQALLDEFNRTNRWGITVNSSAFDGFGRLDEAVEAGLASGEYPDIVVDYGYQARH